ncbi:LuxR C-terminal-related transcriptional regulator [Streptomyces violascens]|uniref:LuxR C-terminal-related transcriptional regulator n=1 Tax=Streptomyces violascens TaxID=67381 RepID=UPI0037BB0D64
MKRGSMHSITERFEFHYRKCVLGAVRSWLAADGDPRVLALTGPIGIGKTTLLADVSEDLSTADSVVVLAGSVGDAKAARHFVDKARIAAGRCGAGARVVLLLDDVGCLSDSDSRMVLELNSIYPEIRVVVTATHEGQFDNVITLPVAPLGRPTDGIPSGADPVMSSEAARFFVHCLRRRNPAVELTRADVGGLARICESSFGVPSDIDALAGLVDRHGLAAVAEAVSEDGPRHRLGELLGETEPSFDRPSASTNTALSVDEMVVLTSILSATGGASTSMLQQSLPRCDISGLTRSLVARGLVLDSAGITSDGAGGTTRQFHLRVTGLPVASWCAVQPEIPLSAIRQAQADYVSSWTRRMAARLSSPEQSVVLAELRRERRNLHCSVAELVHTGRYEQAVALMWDALTLLARTHGITELLPHVLQVIREYAPTTADHQRALHKLAAYVLAAAGEQETAAVYFERLSQARAEHPSMLPPDPDLALLDVLVVERPQTEESADAVAACVKTDIARKDLVRLCESATEYFAYLVRNREFVRVESECRVLLFEATRSGDDYAAGLFLLWRAAAAAGGAAGMEGSRLYVERALAKLKPLGPEAVLSAIGKLIDNRHLRELRQSGAQLAMVLGALRRTDWPRTDDSGSCLPTLLEISERLSRRIGVRMWERWSLVGESADLVDLLCQILPDRPTEPRSEGAAGPPADAVPRGAVAPGRLSEESGLTPRESEVARLVATGLTNKQIGHRLRISEWTAINHLRQVMRKLGCSSRVQVANWVREFDAAAGDLGARPVSADARAPGGAADFNVPDLIRIQARSMSASSEASGSN